MRRIIKHMDSMSFKNVTKWNDEGGVFIDSVDLKIKSNQKVLFIGNSKSGRKELFKLMSGYIKPDDGEVVADGKSAVVYRHFPKLKGLCTQDYIAYVRKFSFKSKVNNSEIEYLMKYYGVWNDRDRKVETLGVYKCLKLMFILALMEETEIILFEEYYQISDKEQEQQFWHFVRRCIEKKEVTLVCFSDSQLPVSLFDKVYVLRDGKIEENRDK